MLRFGPTDALLAVTTSAFDISVLELLLPLVSGACVVLAPIAATRSGLALAAFLRGDAFAAPAAVITAGATAAAAVAAAAGAVAAGAAGAGAAAETNARAAKAWFLPRITAMQATPATWRMVVHAGWSGDRAVRVLCGGEAFPSALLPLASSCRSVHNLYGPTEATIWCTAYHVISSFPASTTGGHRGVPIGLPLGYPGCACAVVDLASGSHEVETGEEGELWVAGPAISFGYFGDSFAALTEERFITRTFSQGTLRWYKTGDVVFRSPAKVLYFVRRVDDEQVGSFMFGLHLCSARVTLHYLCALRSR
jgi:non-ribosomal peptide synthetase component F